MLVGVIKTNNLAKKSTDGRTDSQSLIETFAALLCRLQRLVLNFLSQQKRNCLWSC